jgi:hypothetical protein
MASDDTPPKNRLIATLALISLCTLVALKFILTSYFNEMVDADKREKMSKPEELYAIRAEQNKNLTSSPIPIDQAMKNLENGRPDLVMPKQSDDTGPLLGWAKNPKALPPKPAPTIEPPPMIPADAGAGDAGKNTDGGARRAPPTAPHGAIDGGAAP